MKLVEILAKEMHEWPEEKALDVGQACDGDIHVPGASGAFIRHLGVKFTKAEDWSSANVTRAQWQAERDRQNGGEWKRHRGGSMPKHVSPTDMVECKRRDGEVTAIDKASAFTWPHKHCRATPYRQIMSYRVISQPQAEEVKVKDTTIGTLSYKVEIDTSPAMQAINELSAKWDQVESPLKWRDTVNELDAYIEEFTREREALINRLAEEGFALLPAMTPVMGAADVDMSDWRNWKAGDIVECVTGEYTGVYTKGNQYKVEWVKEDCFSVYDDCDGKSSCDWFDHDAEGLKFISRP